MELLDFLTPSDEISANGGPEDHVVLSSRVRLARNISECHFRVRPRNRAARNRAKRSVRLSPGLRPCAGDSPVAWAT